MEKIEDQASKQAETIAQFDQAVAEIERQACDFLAGPGRLRCLAAFEDDPDAFRFLVAKVLKRREARSILGLLVKVVADEHRSVSERMRSAQPSSESAALVTVVNGGECVVCDGPAYSRFAGVLWCKRHLGEELQSRGMAA